MRREFAGPSAIVVATLIAALTSASHAQLARPERIAGRPNFNGIWQALNSANWNLEAHAAEGLDRFWQMGAIAAIVAGRSVVVGTTIPYLPEAAARREEFRANWPDSDPETDCYLPGIPRANYMSYPFQIVQGGGDILFVYEYASANRLVAMDEHLEPPVDTWMGQSNGRWDGDSLVIETVGLNGRAHLDRSGNHMSAAAIVTERLTLITPEHIDYEVTIRDVRTFSEPWSIRMPLYRHVDEHAQIMEFKCVPFVEEKLYKDLETSE